MAYEALVPSCFATSDSDSALDFEGFPIPAPGPVPETPSGAQSGLGGASIVRESFRARGFSPGVANFLLGAWRPGTRQQYWPHLRRWVNFCSGRGVSAFCPPVNCLLEFLLWEYESGRSDGSKRAFRSMGVIRSAISSIASIDNLPAGKNPFVSRFMSAVFNDNPAFPRYHSTWDPDVVLKFLRSLGPSKDLPLLSLSRKLVMLMRLLSGERGQALLALDINLMVLVPGKVSFRILDLMKTSRPGWHKNVISFSAFPHDSSLCVVDTLSCYLRLTSPLRGAVSKLFITSRKPFRPITMGTLASWTRHVLSASGVNVAEFAAGSTRQASASRARSSMSSEAVMRAVGWTQESTFGRFYHKPVLSDGYSQAILSNFC